MHMKRNRKINGLLDIELIFIFNVGASLIHSQSMFTLTNHTCFMLDKVLCSISMQMKSNRKIDGFLDIKLIFIFNVGASLIHSQSTFALTNHTYFMLGQVLCFPLTNHTWFLFGHVLCSIPMKMKSNDTFLLQHYLHFFCMVFTPSNKSQHGMAFNIMPYTSPTSVFSTKFLIFLNFTTKPM
jgi:hypothetical protein